MIIPEVVKKKVMIKISDVVFDPEFYARLEPNQKLIADYEQNIEQILSSDNLIEIAQNNILIDGYHRWKAAEIVYGKDKEIPAIQHDTSNTDYILLKSSASNTRHGQRNSRQENSRNIRRLYARGFSLEQIQEELGLGKALVYEATVEDRKSEKEEQKKKVIDLYLMCYTQEQIAENMGIPQTTVSDVIKNFTENSTHGIFGKNFNPLLYNIWNTQKGDETSHFGAFPEIFLSNLLYYHTEPFEVVYDPFAGNGTSVDVCKKYYRRYWCSDLIVKPGREDSIKQADAINGIPAECPKPDLVFLDPPYWKQAAGKYSDSADDLGNKDLKAFYTSMGEVLASCHQRKVARVAIVIQPTEYANDLIFVDHILDFHVMLYKHYTVEKRYILPYSTQQYTPQCVEKAKERKVALTLNRDLVVWKIK